jgi:transcriptional regulator GlxA family with amidase domain
MNEPLSAFAILAYDGIESIDIGATYGVLSIAKQLVPELRLFIVSKTGGELSTANGLRVVADYSFGDCPAADVLMVLGGPGWEVACADCEILAFIRAFHQGDGIVASVCTGAMIMGAAGLLDGCSATTKQQVGSGERRPLDLLATRYSDVRAVEARIVDNGSILTGGGVTLGIDMTLYLIRRLISKAVADETTRILEYRHAWKANGTAFADFISTAS